MKKLIRKIVNEKFLNKFGYEIRKLNFEEVVEKMTSEENQIKEVVEEMTSEENQIIDKCLKYSMTNKMRMWALINSINYI